MTIPIWQAFLLFCIGAVSGWLIHVGYIAFKAVEETDQEWFNRMKREAMVGQEQRNKELVKRLMAGK